MLRILNVVGTRPNFIKIGALYHVFRDHPDITPLLVHTGQHYDAQMSDIFFKQLELPEPDLYLGIGSGSHARQTAATMIALEEVFLRETPDVVLVVGDVNSTLAGALTASKLQLPLVHVEAGLRSFDRTMPEEINRMVTDALSDLLYVTEQSGLDNLKNEGVSEEKVLFAGNVMIDSLVRFREKARAIPAAADLNLSPKDYVLMTMHRPANVDDADNLKTIVDVLSELTSFVPVVFPVHPRTRGHMERLGFLSILAHLKNLHLVPPVGYLEFLSLMSDAGLVITDSGGIQEETTFLGVPCITLRDSTERPITVSMGTNELLSLQVDLVVTNAKKAIRGDWKTGSIPPLWDGKAAQRITGHLVAQFQ